MNSGMWDTLHPLFLSVDGDLFEHLARYGGIYQDNLTPEER